MANENQKSLRETVAALNSVVPNTEPRLKLALARIHHNSVASAPEMQGIWSELLDSAVDRFFYMKGTEVWQAEFRQIYQEFKGQ